MNKNIPNFLIDRSNLLKTVFFTGIFSMVFINIYLPFSSELWFKVDRLTFIFGSGILIFTGMGILSISRMFMFYYCKRKRITYLCYFIWLFCEFIIISSVFTFYSWRLELLLEGVIKRKIFYIATNALIDTILVMFLPYSVLWLYFSLQDKHNRLMKIERLYGDGKRVIEGDSNLAISFRDEKGVLRFSVHLDNLFYLESADNYVIIAYTNKGVLTNFIIRNSMKKMADYFKDSKLKRCHRSYMVNIDHIKEINREKNNINIIFDKERVPYVPVSKTYLEEITNSFLNNSK